MIPLPHKSIAIVDLETDSLDIDKAKIKWVGIYSYSHDQYYEMPFKGNEKEIKKLIGEHKVIIGFNFKEYDAPILKNNYNDDQMFDYRILIDLLEISAPKGGKEYGQYNKNKLAQMGIKLKNFSLREIANKLKLSDEGKGDIDYKIFQKDEWNDEEIKEIIKYLKQDIELTKRLFEWYCIQFEPLRKFLPQKDQDKFLHIKSSLSVLAYNIISNKAGLKPEFGEKTGKSKSYAGGHHIEAKQDLVKGNIIEIDFACLPEGEKVFTKNGYKDVKDLVIGDESISMDYKPNKIKTIRKEESNEIIELTLSNGDILKVTPNHKIPIYKGKKKNTPVVIDNIKILEANKINIGDNLISPVLGVDIENGEENDLFELLGIFLCEGRQDKIKRFIVDKRHPRGRNSTASRTELTIKKFELDFRKRIDELLVKYIPYKITWKEIWKTSNGRRYSSFSIKDTRKEVYDCFKKIVDNNYNLETITKNKSNIKSFLRGVFKSDATFNTYRKEFVLQNHDEKLMMIVRRCLDVLGIYYNTYVSKKPEGHNKRKTNSITITYGSELDKLFDWFVFESYRDDRIQNKYSIYNQKNKIVKIINIKKIKGDFNVYNISMERQESPFYIHNGYFTKNSAYPHAIIQGNLCSPIKNILVDDGWTGDDYYTLNGIYDDKEQGKVELALQDMLLERLKAKAAGDKVKSQGYKICINAFYGLTGNPIFKSIYNRNTASDCTSIVRSWLKKLAQTLSVNGFEPLYGFTDSIFVLVPDNLSRDNLMNIVDEYIIEAKKHFIFPMHSFSMGIEVEIKMIWFVAKNCYLYVTTKDKIEYKNTLLNTNTPEAVMKLFKDYMTPIILEKLDIPFTKKELEEQLRLIIEKQPELAAQEYKVTELSEYKVKTSLQYQISDMYGVGRHFLIPNRKGLGVGLQKSTKKKRGIRHCTIEEFKNKNFTVNDIDLTHLLSHLKPFYERNEKNENDKEKQRQLL